MDEGEGLTISQRRVISRSTKSICAREAVTEGSETLQHDHRHESLNDRFHVRAVSNCTFFAPAFRKYKKYVQTTKGMPLLSA